MQVLTEIDFAELAALARAGKNRELLSRVLQLRTQAGFARIDDTEWAYRRVASFLEDGWQETQTYVDLEEECEVTADQLGCVINRLVAGCRYEKQEAERCGAAWVFDGGQADAAAFIFFMATCPPMYHP